MEEEKNTGDGSDKLNEEYSIPKTTLSNETNDQLITDNIHLTPPMEVHHHPKVEKKNFKEYFLEGLMIFLAVTLGFFAENLREAITSHRQVNEYVQSMISDLSSDIVMYNLAINKNLEYAQMIDSIFVSLKTHEPNTGKVYLMARKLTRGNYVISPNAKTYSQMTSTGGLRLILHHQVADSIALYYQLTQSFNYWNDLQRQRVNDMITVNDKLFDATVFYSIAKQLSGNDADSTYLSLNNPPYFSTDPAIVNLVLARYQYFYGFLMLMNKRANDGAAQAERLRSLLMREYGTAND